MEEKNKQVAVIGEHHAPVVPITEAKLVEWMDAFGIGKQLLPNEKKQFIEIALTYQLNPFKREIYCNAYGTGDYRQLSIITGYEVYLKRAERTGDLAGWNCTTEGSVEKKDLRAIITIHRKSWNMPLVHEVEYSEYIQYKKDGTPTKFWSGKPKTMIKKVAMAQGFRLAFPDELGGMPYTSDELPTVMTGAVEAEVVNEPKTPQRKSETELTAEEMAAKAEKAKAALHAADGPKSEPAKPQAPANGLMTATGLLTGHGEPTAGGYVAWEMDNQQREDGKSAKFASKDMEILNILTKKMEAGEKVTLEYKPSDNPRFANNIVSVKQGVAEAK